MGTVNSIQSEPILIAVDGGGSKTDGVALDLDGSVVARARGAGSSPQLSDLETSVDCIDSVIAEVRAGAGDRPVLQTSIYLSGLDLPEHTRAFTQAISTRSWMTGVTGLQAVVENDMFALLRAGTREPNAVAVVCGTGINCLGVSEDGAHARFAALGMLSGDWGGGWFLGEQALWHAARAVDGRGKPTLLTTFIPQFLGLSDVQAVIEAFQFGSVATDRFSEFAPLVLLAADAGDAVARGIVDRQAEEIVTLAVAAMKRLELLEHAVPLVLGGGVLASGNERLLRGIESDLAVRAPKARMELVRSPPILGAALLALETVGASPEAVETARAALEYSAE